MDNLPLELNKGDLCPKNENVIAVIQATQEAEAGRFKNSLAT